MAQLWQSKVESIFHSDRFDLQDYLKATAAYPRLASTNDQAARDYCGQPGQDAFLDLYKAAPRLADPTPKALSPLRSLIERGRQTPEYQKLRAGSVGDLVSAAVGAEVYVDRIMRGLPEEVKEAAKEQAKKQRKADEAQTQADAAKEFGDLLAEIAKEAAEAGNHEKAELSQTQADEAYQRALEAAEKAKDLQAEAAMAEAAFDQAMADYDAQIQAALNNAAGQATEQAAETSTLVKSFSLAAGGDGEFVDPEQARQIMQLMARNRNLQDLADLLGWAKQMVRAEWRKSARGHVQMTGYKKQPLRPSKMASFEMARMVSPEPAIRQDWQRRAADNAVMHRQFEGEQEQGRGDLVIVRDESGSMAGPEHATAIALEWALLEIACRDHRGFISVPFSGSGEFSVWRAPAPGKPDVPGLLAHLGHFYGGGTEPYLPLSKALVEIAGTDLKADILLITDGSFAQPPAEFLRLLAEARQKRPLKVVTVVIGGPSGSHQAGKFSDKVIFVNDLFTDREKLRAAVAEVV